MGDTFRNKYLKDSDLIGYKIRGGDSSIWKGIARSMEEVRNCAHWRLGRGNRISIWNDVWVGSLPISTRLEGDILNEEKEWTVSELFDANGMWDRSKIHTEIPDNIWKEIESLPVPMDRDQEDKRVWGGTPNGKFSCKSAYHHLITKSEVQNSNATGNWDWIWKINFSERMRFFIWTSTHKSLATNLMRFERKLTTSATCPRCNFHAESIVHALRDCVWAKQVWEFVIVPTQFLKFTQIDADSWIKVNITKERFDNIIFPNIPWCMMFIALVWSIWKSRNKFIFQNTREPVKLVISAAKGIVEDMNKTSKRKGVKIQKPQDQISWSLPRTGWHKLNTDGSVSNSKKTTASGGLLRDDMGNWVVGFSRKLGDTSITIAELLAIREGLHLAWERRIPKLEIESDSEVVVNFIKEANADIHPLGNIIRDCRNLIRMRECRLVHKRRSGNTCADALAKNGHSLEDGVIWETVPEFMIPLLREDLM